MVKTISNTLYAIYSQRFKPLAKGMNAITRPFYGLLK